MATALGVSQVKLSWSASTDNAGVTKYEVQRQDPGSTSFVHVTTTTGTNYTDAGLAAGSSYSYRVLVEGCDGEAEGVFGGGKRDNSFTNDCPSQDHDNERMTLIASPDRAGRWHNHPNRSLIDCVTHCSKATKYQQQVTRFRISDAIH